MFASTGFSLLTFLALVGGMLIHASKQFRVASKNQAELTARTYFLEHWPETLSGIVGSLIIWAGVPEFVDKFPDIAKTISLDGDVGIISSAICGFLGNWITDWFGSRVQALSPQVTQQRGFASVRVMPLLAAIAVCALTLGGCVASFDQRLASAYSANTSVRAVAAAAVDAGDLSSADGRRVLEITDRARAILDEAEDGDERGLALAVEIIKGVERGIDR